MIIILYHFRYAILSQLPCLHGQDAITDLVVLQWHKLTKNAQGDVLKIEI